MFLLQCDFLEFELKELRNCTSANFSLIHQVFQDPENTTLDFSPNQLKEELTEDKNIEKSHLSKFYPSGSLDVTYTIHRYPTIEVEQL